MTSNLLEFPTGSALLHVALVGRARYCDAAPVNAVAVSSAMDMTPGQVYADHAATNRERISRGGQRRVQRLIELSVDCPELWRVFVTILHKSSLRPITQNHVIGYIFAKVTEPTEYYSRKHVLIHGLAVEGAWRRYGIGRELISGIFGACAWAREIGLPVCANVADTNKPMLQLLAHNGFIDRGAYGPVSNSPVSYRVMVREPTNEPPEH